MATYIKVNHKSRVWITIQPRLLYILFIYLLNSLIVHQRVSHCGKASPFHTKMSSPQTQTLKIVHDQRLTPKDFLGQRL